MLRIPWTEKKSTTEEVLNEAGVQQTMIKRICQQLPALLGHIMKMHSLENLVVTCGMEGRRLRGRQRLKYLDSCDCEHRGRIM